MPSLQKKKRILDKVELEKKIDFYLKNDIPLSLLEDEYQITFPQMQLLLNRIRGYSYKTAKLDDRIPAFTYDDVNSDMVAIPHIIEESYPLRFEDSISLFKRLAKLQQEMTSLKEQADSLIKEEESLTLKLSSYDTNTINRIKNFLISFDSNPNIDEQTLISLLSSNNLSVKEIPNYNTIYSEYLNLEERLNIIRKEISSSKKKLKITEEEYLNIRETLVVCNIKLVNWCIRKFFNNIPLPLEDTQMYGLEGLTIAINNFDYKKGFHFSSYAVPIIVHNIEKNFSELYGMKWRDFVAKEKIRYNRELMLSSDPSRQVSPSPEELADMGLIDMSASTIRNYDEMLDGIYPMSSVYDDIPLDYPKTTRYEMPTTEEDYKAIDKYQDQKEIPSDIDVEEEVITRSLKDKLNSVLDSIQPTEKEIIIKRYGLNGEDPKTYKELSIEYNATPERIRQIEAKVLRKLRHPRRSKQIKDYVYESQGGLGRQHINYSYILQKMISLIKLNIRYENITTFINFEGLNWNIEDLNYHVFFINQLLEAIKRAEQTYGNEEEYIMLELRKTSEHFNIYLSQDFYKYILNNLEEITSLIELTRINNNIPFEEYIKKISEEEKRRFI